MLSLLLCAVLQSPDVVATDLQGNRVSGRLVRVDAEAAVVATVAGEKQIPAQQLLDLKWPSRKKIELPAGQVYLLDGSTLTFTSLQTAGRSVSIESPIYGSVALPRNSIRAVRFGELSTAAEPWKKLLARERTKDVLVLPKKNRAGELSPTAGVVGGIDAENVRFVLGGDEIPVKLSRVFGVVYARKPVKPTGAYVVEVAARDRLMARSIVWDAGTSKMSLTLTDDASVVVGDAYLDRVDSSGGKIRYLDAMTPTDYQFSSVLPDKLAAKIFRYRRKQTMDGKPLMLGGKKYERGLWIHSRSVLKYSLAGEYSRFEALAGIDDDIPRRNKTKARLTIKADERVLFDEDIWTTDKPRPLKLDVRNAQVLEILVDFGEKRADGLPPLDASLQDWVDLVDARVLK